MIYFSLGNIHFEKFLDFKTILKTKFFLCISSVIYTENLIPKYHTFNSLELSFTTDDLLFLLPHCLFAVCDFVSFEVDPDSTVSCGYAVNKLTIHFQNYSSFEFSWTETLNAIYSSVKHEKWYKWNYIILATRPGFASMQCWY